MTYLLPFSSVFLEKFNFSFGQRNSMETIPPIALFSKKGTLATVTKSMDLSVNNLLIKQLKPLSLHSTNNCKNQKWITPT